MKASALAACAAILMSSAAFAQTTTPPATTPPTATPPATTAPPARTPTATPPARTPSGETQMKSKAPTQEVTGAWHTKDFFRSRVYNMNGERVGDVNDILIDDGQVTAFVVGVGGFLGIGEKEVSLKPDQVKRMVHSDGETYFTVNTTKEQLQAAPEYVRPAKQARQPTK
jgi:sporulation protein YlmC with PRC-barrel domain